MYVYNIYREFIERERDLFDRDVDTSDFWYIEQDLFSSSVTLCYYYIIIGSNMSSFHVLFYQIFPPSSQPFCTLLLPIHPSFTFYVCQHTIPSNTFNIYFICINSIKLYDPSAYR